MSPEAPASAPRLLLDQNISPRLGRLISDVFRACVHVRDVGLATASDAEVWEFAAAAGLTIVSKDADFLQRGFLYGPPPKFVWIRLGNCSTNEIASLLREHADRLAAFHDDPVATVLALG